MAGEVGDGSLPVASAGAADTEPADASAGLRSAAAATVKATFIATPPPPTRWEAERPRSRATAACWSPPPRRATLSRPKRWRGLRTTAAAAVNATVGGTPTVLEEVEGSKAMEADDGSFPVASAAATDVQPADLQPAEASAGVEKGRSGDRQRRCRRDADRRQRGGWRKYRKGRRQLPAGCVRGGGRRTWWTPNPPRTDPSRPPATSLWPPTKVRRRAATCRSRHLRRPMCSQSTWQWGLGWTWQRPLSPPSRQSADVTLPT